MHSHLAADPTRFVFVLQPEFPISAAILASEALRIANQNSGQEHFAWQFVSETGEQVRASNGMRLRADADFEGAWRADVCLLFEGNLPTQHVSRKLLAYLRNASRFGAVVGGVDTGAFALSQAGLVTKGSGSDVVLHWEAVPAFRERFPSVTARNRIFLCDDHVVSSAGGTATLDLILELIARFRGEPMANEVSNALVHARREGETRQRQDWKTEFGADSVASGMVRVMERNLDFPLALGGLAEHVGVPKRTLARVCERAFGISPMRLYLRIRLQAARNLLFYEEHAISDIATACGFSYPAAFSRAFDAQFGMPPSEFRKKLRKRQRSIVQPEIHRLIATSR